jgi:hypothetical protein
VQKLLPFPGHAKRWLPLVGTGVRQLAEPGGAGVRCRTARTPGSANVVAILNFRVDIKLLVGPTGGPGRGDLGR